MEDTKKGMEVVVVQKYVDNYWGEIVKIWTAMGQTWFLALAEVRVAVLTLPHSNADCEGWFSIIRNVHTSEPEWGHAQSTFPGQAQQREVMLWV